MNERFLISKLSSLGDVVCCLPVARSLRSTFPQSEIVWVVDQRYVGIVECCDAVDTVHGAAPGFAPSTWLTAGGRFTAAFDLQGLLKSALVIARCKAERKLGYHWQREGSWLFSQPVLPDPSSLHVVDQYVDVSRAAGASGDRAEFGLVPKPKDVEAVSQLLAEIGVHGPFVAINAGAGWASKRWPPSSFALVIEGLQEMGVSSVLIGGSGQEDAEVVRAVREASRIPVRSLHGRTSVRELVALLSVSAAHLGGDTGSSHIAAALGKPAVGLYSVTRPARSCPYGQIERCHYHATSLSDIRSLPVLQTLREVIP